MVGSTNVRAINKTQYRDYAITSFGLATARDRQKTGYLKAKGFPDYSGNSKGSARIEEIEKKKNHLILWKKTNL